MKTRFKDTHASLSLRGHRQRMGKVHKSIEHLLKATAVKSEPKARIRCNRRDASNGYPKRTDPLQDKLCVTLELGLRLGLKARARVGLVFVYLKVHDKELRKLNRKLFR